MKAYKFKKTEWYRFKQLCKLFGFKVSTSATYTYSNLVETEHCYLQIQKDGQVVAIADLIQ